MREEGDNHYMGKTYYYKTKEALIKQIISLPTFRAYGIISEHLILSYVLMLEEVILFSYTKYEFRKKGFMTAIFKEIGMNYKGAKCYELTDKWKKVCRNNFIYMKWL